LSLLKLVHSEQIERRQTIEHAGAKCSSYGWQTMRL
jgi:hypothetical protein